MGFVIWRRRRDLNPRYPFGVYTISNRARSASYATSPCAYSSCRLAYNTLSGTFCQARIFTFFEKLSEKLCIILAVVQPVCICIINSKGVVIGTSA